MAEQKKKTQAEKAASAAKQKAAEKQPRIAKKDTKAKPEPAAPVKEPLIPVRALLAIICLFLFVVFLVMALKTARCCVYSGISSQVLWVKPRSTYPFLRFFTCLSFRRSAQSDL